MIRSKLSIFFLNRYNFNNEEHMNTNLNRTTIPPVSTPRRLFREIWRQSKKTSFCPKEPRLDGKLALVTGGNGGIGLETCKGLAQRGAEVVILARNLSKAEQAIKDIKTMTGSEVDFIPFDLSDLETVIPATDEIEKKFPNRTIDLFIANAGIVATQYSQSAQGFEISFAINVLGHHALIRRLHNRSKLTPDSRIVMLTGDIYFRATECTPNFKYEDKKGAEIAYCRSKLGNLWWVKEWTKRFKEIEAYAAHPGVVASNLGGEASGFVRKLLRSKIMISTEKGAQTTLLCATQENLESGGYCHNTMGHMLLSEKDPASDSKKAAEFWEMLEKSIAGFIE
jgi:retinol dehydrogenase 12